MLENVGHVLVNCEIIKNFCSKSVKSFVNPFFTFLEIYFQI